MKSIEFFNKNKYALHVGYNTKILVELEKFFNRSHEWGQGTEGEKFCVRIQTEVGRATTAWYLKNGWTILEPTEFLMMIKEQYYEIY